jgi:hypothetical protein
MSKERYNQIIDDTYKNYLIEDVKVLPNMSKEKMTEMGFRLSKDEFINKCKNDQEFSEKWGLKIEERELSLEERMQIWNEHIKGLFIMLIWGHDKTQEESLNEHNIPNKQITLTYQDEKIQFYE